MSDEKDVPVAKPEELKDEELNEVAGGADKQAASPNLYQLCATGRHLVK